MYACTRDVDGMITRERAGDPQPVHHHRRHHSQRLLSREGEFVCVCVWRRQQVIRSVEVRGRTTAHSRIEGLSELYSKIVGKSSPRKRAGAHESESTHTSALRNDRDNASDDDVVDNARALASAHKKITVQTIHLCAHKRQLTVIRPPVAPERARTRSRHTRLK